MTAAFAVNLVFYSLCVDREHRNVVSAWVLYLSLCEQVFS